MICHRAPLEAFTQLLGPPLQESAGANPPPAPISSVLTEAAVLRYCLPLLVWYLTCLPIQSTSTSAIDRFFILHIDRPKELFNNYPFQFRTTSQRLTSQRFRRKMVGPLALLRRTILCLCWNAVCIFEYICISNIMLIVHLTGWSISNNSWRIYHGHISAPARKYKTTRWFGCSLSAFVSWNSPFLCSVRLLVLLSFNLI